MNRKALTLILSILLLVAFALQPLAAAAEGGDEDPYDLSSHEEEGIPITEGNTGTDAEIQNARMARQWPNEPGDSEPGNGAKDLLSDNIHFGPAGISLLLYGKSIDLSGLGLDNVQGKLHFRLTPDPNASGSYEFWGLDHQPDNPDPDSRIKIVPGVMTFDYELPFSSDDYVDTKYNEMAMSSLHTNGDNVALMNHALLHEWGRLVSSDHGQTALVGKITPAMFGGDREKYEEALSKYSVDWSAYGDPETAVVGWKCGQEPENLASDDCLIGLEGSGCENLNAYPDFQNGSFQYSEVFKLYQNKAITYVVPLITRPIAIRKIRDENNRIVGIDKPLFPSIEIYRFQERHAQLDVPAEDDNYQGEGPYPQLIYRYRLSETTAEGLELEGDGTSLIVDVVDPNIMGNIFMFRTEDEADQFYKKRIAELEKSESTLTLNDWRYGFRLSDSTPITLMNRLPRTDVSVQKVWKDEEDKNGKRPASVDVYLLADGEKTGKYITLSKENGWEGSFKDLNLYKYWKDENDKIQQELIQYTISEPLVEHYETHVDVVEKNLKEMKFTLTNTYTDDIVSLDIDKIWDDENDKEKKRPPLISIFLLKNGEVIDRREITAADGWKTRYEDLARYDEKGREITYSIKEAPIERYEAIIDGFHITNKLKPCEPCPTTPCEPCEPSNPCKPPKPCKPCEPRHSNDWPPTPQQKTPGIVTQTAESSQASSTQAPTAGMLPVTADGSFANVLYAALLLILAAAVTALRYEMKRRKEN